MSNWMVLVGCAVIGWLLVSFLFRKKPDRDSQDLPPASIPPPRPASAAPRPSTVRTAPPPSRPVPPSRPAPPSGTAGGDTNLSVTFLSLKWHELLGVPQHASDAEIDAAYYAIIAEFDRLAFDRNATDEQKHAALERRQGAAEAWQFIRAARGRR